MSGRVIQNSHLKHPFTKAHLKAVERQQPRMTTFELNKLTDKMKEEQLHTLRTNTPSRNASRTPLFSAITSGVSGVSKRLSKLKHCFTKNQETQFIPLGMSPTKGAVGGYNSRKPKKPTVLTKKPMKAKKFKAKNSSLSTYNL